MTDAGAASAEIPLIRGFLLKKADAADGTGSEGQIQLFRALSTALFRSAVHSLELITMITRFSLQADDCIFHIAPCLCKLGGIIAVDCQQLLLVAFSRHYVLCLTGSGFHQRAQGRHRRCRCSSRPCRRLRPQPSGRNRTRCSWRRSRTGWRWG